MAAQDVTATGFFARPAGKMKDEAINASAFRSQTASCACLSNMPSIQ